MENKLRGRDLISGADLAPVEVLMLFDLARDLKAGEVRLSNLDDKSVALVFEKPSLRTRVTFETAIFQLGGHPVYLSSQDIQMGLREPAADVGRNLERWVAAVVARVNHHSVLDELADNCSVPVINALSDFEHPCQALADLFTVRERKHKLRGLKLAFVGDGCNTCHSLMQLCPKAGVDMAVATPPGYEPEASVCEEARSAAEAAGTRLEVTSDPVAAVRGAGVVYTDVWASMGLESERQERLRVFPPYQVNEELLAHAEKDAIVLHCLPAHRGEEITEEILRGPQSAVFDQAENRLHVQKALLALLV
jgi:ornithine carbamoyltransferase